MKKIKILSVLAALFMLLPAFVSCDKDDPTAADAIIGTYSGTLGYSVMGFDPGTIDGDFDLRILKDKDDNDDVTVVIPECTFAPPIPNARPFTIPSLTIDDVDVTARGDVYTFKEDSFTLTIDGKVYEGSNLIGTVTGKKVALKYQLKPATMPMDILFSFDGNVKK